MSFSLPFGVRVSNTDPVDFERYLAQDLTERNTLVGSGREYVGLQVYVTNDATPANNGLYILSALPATWLHITDESGVIGGGGATELNDLSDVDTVTTPPADGQSLVWNNALGVWRAENPPTGDVFKVGTPVSQQVGVWTGDGTIEGTSNLTYNGGTLSITGQVSSTLGVNAGSLSIFNNVRITNAGAETDFATARLFARNNTSGDVTVLNPSGGGTTNFLRADGQWALAGASQIDDLTDVDTTTTPPTVDQVLSWNGIDNWVPDDQWDGPAIDYTRNDGDGDVRVFFRVTKQGIVHYSGFVFGRGNSPSTVLQRIDNKFAPAPTPGGNGNAPLTGLVYDAGGDLTDEAPRLNVTTIGGTVTDLNVIYRNNRNESVAGSYPSINAF